MQVMQPHHETTTAPDLENLSNYSSRGMYQKDFFHSYSSFPHDSIQYDLTFKQKFL